MNKLRRIGRFMPHGNKLAALLYVVIFTCLLSRALQGVGQYWDWTFPYYADQVSNFFGRASQSWTELAQGSPLGYSSDYFVRWAISLFNWLHPEWLMFAVLVGLFTAGGYGVYIIARRHTRGWIAFLLGAAAFINPTIFYKFTAGHIDYLVSYVLLIYLVYFLLYRFRPDWRSAVVVGLMWALMGAQIQFLAIAGLLIALFFFFRRDLWRWKFLLPLLLLPLCINAVWLSNFAFGGADVSAISGEATKGSFRAASSSDYLDIFSFSFSKATLISRFYGFYELMLYALLFVLMLVALLKSRHKQSEDVWLLSFLLIILFLATGLFQLINLGPLTTLYPMFREVGHFAPVIVLAMIVLIGRLMPRGAVKAMMIVWLLLVIGISFVRYQVSTQSINFSAARAQFVEFKRFDDAHQTSDGRVLMYPFFGQYSFLDFPQQFQDNLPLRNSGHDGFSTFSDSQFVKNAVKPQDFKLSLQYRLLKTRDIDVLKPYNIRYIYDMSDVYESYYDRYVSPSTYDGDLRLIKNNADLMGQLLAANPGKVRRVSDHILEITDYTPRVVVGDRLYGVGSQIEGEAARPFMSQVFDGQTYDYVDRSTTDVPAYAGSLTPLFVSAKSDMVNAASKSLTQTVTLDPSQSTKLYASQVPSTVAYQAVDGVVTFFAMSTGKFYVNGQLAQDPQTMQPTIISQIKMAPDKEYFIGLEGNIKPLKRNGAEIIGRLGDSDELALYAGAASNLVTNPSFEPGLWGQNVGDCNNYDKRPKIAMRQSTATASDGSKSLELEASRHDACTSTSFPLHGDSLYLLSYDYQSPHAETASFYLRFNNSDQQAIKRYQAISDDQWHSASYPIVTPEDAHDAQLFLHAQGSNSDQPNINRYDNVHMTELVQVGEFTIPRPQATYTMQDLRGGAATFDYADPTYSYQNVVANGSFEQGAWRTKVQDCNNYDKSPKISMNIDTSDKKDGSQSLSLGVTRHAACTYTNVTVEPSTDYILSFDYKVDGEGQIGYNADFDGVDGGARERFSAAGQGWQTYATKIHTPSATSMKLYLHAYESNGTDATTAHFDNVKLIAVPSVEGQFFAVGEPSSALTKPKGISFKTDSETRRTITVRGATGPFMLVLSETYHPSWRLELRDAAAQSWQPGVHVAAVKDHFKTSGYANGWLVDPALLCAQAQEGCRKNADGSYDINLTAEFVPQRWFVINRVVSWGTLVGALGYVALTHRRAKRRYEAEGIYSHPLAKKRKPKK